MADKTIIDYLKKHGHYSVFSPRRTFSLQLLDGCNTVALSVDVSGKNDRYIQQDISDALSACGIDIRFCGSCGAPMDDGFTVEDSDWYCCEKCFEETMNQDYGPENWRPSKGNKCGEFGGYYEERMPDGEWQDTGIYWTSWYE